MKGGNRALAVMMALASFAHPAQVCDLSFDGCPRSFSDAVIKVPPEYTGLDVRVPHCQEFIHVSGGNAKPPSIVFVIDNSGSMNENDPMAARFDVVASLLEDIRDAEPSAAVGLVVFTRRLSFDHRENAFFRTAFPRDTSQHDSFAPLTPLDKAFPNGRTGLDTLKSLLKHDEQGNLIYATRLPASRANPVMNRSDTRNGTDISLGFLAAKEAMRDSKSDSAQRFIVFLSDGAPSTPDIGREASVDEFVAGAGVPATFTVFFDTQNIRPVAPATIVQMTANIRANGYSSANPKSGYWAVNQPGTQLEEVLRGNVVGNVLSVPAKPKDLVVASGDSTFHAAAQDDKGFVFARRMNLQADTTRLVFDYAYAYIDSSNGVAAAKEKIVPYPLTIVRSAGPLPAGLGGACRDQAQVGLYRDGQPITAVTVDDARLEARLTPPESLDCKNCGLKVSAGRLRDSVSLALSPAPGYLSGILDREESASPVPGDGRLQNTRSDSIIVEFVNPENPLDRVRRAYPYFGAPSLLKAAQGGGLVRPPILPPDPRAPAFVLVAPPAFRPSPRGPGDQWRLDPAPPAQEAERYASLTVTASRAFAVDMNVFSNLGNFVDRLEFAVDQGEFEKLSEGPSGHTRLLRVLWDGRSREGNPVATGAYIVKTTVRLLPVPGIAEDNAETTEYRRVGILRAR